MISLLRNSRKPFGSWYSFRTSFLQLRNKGISKFYRCFGSMLKLTSSYNCISILIA